MYFCFSSGGTTKQHKVNNQSKAQKDAGEGKWLQTNNKYYFIFLSYLGQKTTSSAKKRRK